MTRVDFYVLPEGSLDPVPTACRLCDKAVGAGHRVFVYADPARVEALDGALWSFRQGSFLAHEPWPQARLEPPLPAILLGDEAPPDSHLAVLVNLMDTVPPWVGRFERALEIVYGDAATRARSRERYKVYRDRGYPLNTHSLPTA